jgi:uncharacterized protein (TIRG00374 family)
MKQISKSKIFISILLITIFYILLTIFSDIDKIKVDYQNFNVFYFLPILPILFLSMFLRSILQKYMLKKLGIEIPLKSSFLIFLGGYAMIMTPGGIGLIIKSYLLQKKFGYKISQSLPLVFAERFYDIFAVQIIILFSLISFHSDISIILSIIIIIGLILILSIIKINKLNWILLSLAKKFKIIDDEQNNDTYFLNSIKTLFEFKFFIIISLIVLAIVFFEGVIFYLSFNIFGISISYVESLQIYYTSMLLGSITFLPAGIGVIEGIFVILLSERNVSLHLATSTILFIRFVSIWLLSGIGALISIKMLFK